jgi:hypothetical protein
MKTQDIRNMGLAMQQVQEAPTATHKPNNGQDPEQGLSPNAKKEKARTSGVGVDANDSIAKSFKAFRANSKAAKYNGGINPPGDKAIIKSTMAPAANQRTEAVSEVNMMAPSVMTKPKTAKSVKAAYHGKEAMDPVGKADADIDNDGDVDSSDRYLHKRRKAISARMKSKKEDAVMHGGKTGAKSEKKEKETMAVGEGAMKRMSSGDGMDTYKKKPKDEAFSSSAIVKKDRRGDGKPMGDPRQMKDPKKDSMVSKDGKVKVIDKDKEKDHLKKGFVRAEAVGDGSKPMRRPTSSVTTSSSSSSGSPAGLKRNKPKVSALNTRRKEIKTGIANTLSTIVGKGSPAVSKPKPFYKGFAKEKERSRKFQATRSANTAKGTDGPLEVGTNRFGKREDYSAPKMNQVTPNTSNAMSKYKTKPTMPKTPKPPAKPQIGMDAPAAKKGSPY